MQQAQLEIQGEKILRLIESPSEQADIQLFGQTVLPGLINCHTHLEFSDLHSPIPAQAAFPEWISAVIRHRRGQQNALTEAELHQARSAAVIAGLNESIKCGTAALVDIATEPYDLTVFDQVGQARMDTRQSISLNNDPEVVMRLNAPTEIFCLPEVIGLDDDRWQHTYRWATELASNRSSAGDRSCIRTVGVSPHAPYSLKHPQVIDQLGQLDRQTLIAMHIAESLDELEWSRHGTGSFREVYSRVGLPLPDHRMQIEQAIELLSQFDRALLVHGNYLTEQQLDQVAKSSTAIVYCPRTHHHFRHQPYPFQSIAARSIPLLLGTDSRASNPDLDMWLECRQAGKAHPDWSAADIVQAVTVQAAKYLGIDDYLGSLQPGHRFVVRCLDTPEGATTANLLELLVRGS